MRPERALNGLAVDFLRPRPALGRAQHDHRPHGSLAKPIDARVGLNPLDLADDLIQYGGHPLVHRLGLIAFDEVGRVSITAKQRLQLVAADAGQHCRAGDFVAVQVQDGQHRPIMDRIEKLVRVPTGRQRSGLGLAVADHADDQQIGIVERRAVGMGQGVAQFSAFVDRPGRFGRGVAGNSTRKGKLGK